MFVKNSFVNISEVNRQCLHSLGTRSEDDFEKVSIFTINALHNVYFVQYIFPRNRTSSDLSYLKNTILLNIYLS